MSALARHNDSVTTRAMPMQIAVREKTRTKTRIAIAPIRDVRRAPNRIRHRSLRFLAALTFVLPSLICAQALDAQRLFEQGRAAFEQANYTRALEAFEAAHAARMDGPAIHFNIGVAAYRAGRYDRARAAFARAALTPSMAGLAHYNLGLVALAQKDEPAAIEAFTSAYAASDDERVRALARTQLEAIGAPVAVGIAWAVYGSSGIGYDDNVTLAAAGQAIGVSREEDVYADTYVAGSAQLTSAWRVDADASFLNYADLDEFDQWGIGAGARYRFAPDLWTIDVGGQLATTYLDGERFDLRETAYLQARRVLTSAATARARYRLSHVDGNDAYPGLDGLLHELTAGLVQRWAAFTAGVGYAFEINDYDAAALSATRHELSADVRAPLTRLWRARATLAYRHSDYDDPAIGAEERLEFGAAAELALSERWTLAIQYLFTDNDADAPEFTYRRNRVFVGVDATF